MKGVGVIHTMEGIPPKCKVKLTTLATTTRTSTRKSKSFYATEREMRSLSSMSLSYSTKCGVDVCTRALFSLLFT